MCIRDSSKCAYDKEKSEIGGMLIAEKDKDGNYDLHSPVILKQEISAGNTTICKEALSVYYVEQAMKHKNKDIRFVWWHSHHTMAVFWSGTDLTAIDEMSSGDMSLSLVVNLKEEYKFRVNIWKPFKIHKDIEIDIIDNSKARKYPKSIENEFDKLCEKETYFTKAISNKVRQNSHKSLQGQLWRSEAPVVKGALVDEEAVEVEAFIDNCHTDRALGRIDHKTYLSMMKNKNIALTLNKSELRVGFVEDEKVFDNIVFLLEADQFMYVNGGKWSIEDVCIENDITHSDVSEAIYYNDSYGGY